MKKDLSPIARPYANALFLAALDAKQESETHNHLGAVKEIFKHKDVGALISSPELSKKEILTKLFTLLPKEANLLVRNLLSTLSTNDRLEALEEIFRIYDQLLSDHHNKQNIDVVMPIELDKNKQDKVEELLLKKYGEAATLHFSVDKSLIGGITIKVDDEVLDLSIRGKVQKLVNELNF